MLHIHLSVFLFFSVYLEDENIHSQCAIRKPLCSVWMCACKYQVVLWKCCYLSQRMTPDIVQKNNIAASWWASRNEEKRNGKSESGCAGVCVKSCCAVQLSEMKVSHLWKVWLEKLWKRPWWSVIWENHVRIFKGTDKCLFY